MNLCAACQTDFASVKAFDTHRIGVHAYTFAEGLEMDQERIDGRRCMDADEMSDCECVGVPSGAVVRVAPCSLSVTQFPHDPACGCLASDLSRRRGRCRPGARLLA